MLFANINLKKALIRERNQQHLLLDQVNELLHSASAGDHEILSRLKESPNGEHSDLNLTEKENIFSLDEIKQICIRYRLRFLDTAYFNSEYPYSAIAEIKAFEKKYGFKINQFRIMAPAESFELENINRDPLLFMPINEKYYYLIHQWGNDLPWHRRIFSYPFQSFKTLLISLLIVSFLFAFILPSSIMHVFNIQSEIYLRIWLAIHTFIGLLGFTLWAGLSFDKSFSAMNWNSKYYNY